MNKQVVPTKDRVRNMIVELVMSNWSKKVLMRLQPKFKAYVFAQHPEATIESDGKRYFLKHVEGLRCSGSSEADVWALAAKELAR